MAASMAMAPANTIPAAAVAWAAAPVNGMVEVGIGAPVPVPGMGVEVWITTSVVVG